MALLTENPKGPSSKLFSKQLDDLTLQKSEKQNEIEFCENELNRLKDQKPIGINAYKKILEQFEKKWQISNYQEKREMFKTMIRNVKSSVKIDNSGWIEVVYIADKKLEADWVDIKNANSDGIKVRTSGLSGSPAVADMRTYFRIKWPIRVINEGRRGIKFKIDKEKLLKNYPFFKGGNILLTGTNVNQKESQPVKKRWTREEQAAVFIELLNTGKVKNRAQLAKKFGVSRAWVTKVLS